MNWKWFIIFLTIAIGLSLLVDIATASVELHQGDIAYLSERVDLSRTIAWPDYKLAWCTGGDYGCTPPDQIIQVTGYMYDYFLDPAVWHTGTYYRWDGHWNEGENMEAFTINPGTRPEPISEPGNLNVTDETVIPNVTIEGPYHYLVARGDNPVITVRIARDDPGHLWMFGSTKQVLDLPMKKDGFDYSYQMTLNDTFSTSVGTYSGYLQFDGKNGMQDVYWNDATKCIETPYRRSLQADVCPNIWNTASVRAEFENMVKTGYNSDDILIPVTMQVTEPEIVITDLIRDSNSIWIQGKTTWSAGTILTLKLDPDNYKLAQEIRLHTWTATINGTLDNWRIFAVSCPLEMDEMYIGVHDFEMSVTKNKYVTKTGYTFRITDTYVMPTPTRATQKIIEDMSGNKIAMSTTVIPTRTPNATPVPTFSTPTKTDVQNVTPVVTRAPLTPTPTRTPTPTPIPTTDVVNVPLESYVAVAALIAAVWRRF